MIENSIVLRSSILKWQKLAVTYFLVIQMGLPLIQKIHIWMSSMRNSYCIEYMQRDRYHARVISEVLFLSF